CSGKSTSSRSETIGTRITARATGAGRSRARVGSQRRAAGHDGSAAVEEDVARAERPTGLWRHVIPEIVLRVNGAAADPEICAGVAGEDVAARASEAAAPEIAAGLVELEAIEVVPGDIVLEPHRGVLADVVAEVIVDG